MDEKGAAPRTALPQYRPQRGQQYEMLIQYSKAFFTSH